MQSGEKSGGVKMTAKKASTSKTTDKATDKTELPPSFYNPGKKRGKDIPDN
jgi:hypothetical protein